MLLAVDIGNTNIVVGCFDNANIIAEIRLKTDSDRTRDEFSAMLISLLNSKLGQDFRFDAAIVSSVVPPLTLPFCDLIKSEFNLNPLIVSSKLNLAGIELKIDAPATLGADRIADIVAAKIDYGVPSLILDFGTATTFDYLDKNGCYRGGPITPGLNISLDALISRTAQLPRVAMVFPDSVIATNTITAIQSGTLIGYECLVTGLIDYIEKQARENIEHIILTGGLGNIFTERINGVFKDRGVGKQAIYDGNLTLKGLNYLWKLNK